MNTRSDSTMNLYIITLFWILANSLLRSEDGKVVLPKSHVHVQAEPSAAKAVTDRQPQKISLKLSGTESNTDAPIRFIYSRPAWLETWNLAIMPRSATDATRFTSTTPYASKKVTPPSSNQPPPKRPGPLGETPQEKVKRLRAAANAARDAQVSTFDKVIVRGRVWADKIHRFTALSLIGVTFIAGGVTVYALGDMMIYNRRKRAEFFTEQKAKHLAAIHDAKLAIDHGTATESQLQFIAREEAEDARIALLEQEKAQKKGIFGTAKQWLLSGLKKEEEGDYLGSAESRLGYEALSEEDDSLGERESDIVRAIEDKKIAIQEKARKAFADEKERQRTGGTLDRIGTSTDNTGSREEPPKSGGWTSFMTRR